jgi:dipeptidyl aminopeptidase/acylaminoacyl peptidase
MTRITHSQAHKYMHLAADKLLQEGQRAELNEHLRECASCLALSERLNALDHRLKKVFHTRWDNQDGPEMNIPATIRPTNRRVFMTNRFIMGLKFLAVTVLLLVLVIASDTIFSKLKTSSIGNSIATGSPTAPITTFTPNPQPYNSLIAFDSDKTGNFEIYTMHMDGSDETNLSNNPGQDILPKWSPDGKRIAFTSDRNGYNNIYVMNSNGSDLSQLSQNDDFVWVFTWSPDGKKIVYETNPSQVYSGQIGIGVMNADGSGKIKLTGNLESGTFLSWSPDGQKIVYHGQDLGSDQYSSNSAIYIINADGTNKMKLLEADNNVMIKWENAQQFYAIISSAQIYRFSTDGTPAKLVASYETPISSMFGSGLNIYYVVKISDTWFWHHLEGATTTSGSIWPSFSSKCQSYQRDLYLNDASNWPSPNGEFGLVNVSCFEGVSLFYYVTADGTMIKLLFNDPIPLYNLGTSWSPDGKYVTVEMGSFETAKVDLYFIDIERTLLDPSLRPVRLTTDNARINQVVWQPQP